MPLDPQAKVLIDLIEGTGGFDAHARDADPQQLRDLYAALAPPVHDRGRAGRGPRRSRARRARSRCGSTGPTATRPKPAIVYYHGGGWVIGGLDTHDGDVPGVRQRGRRGRRLGRLPARARAPVPGAGRRRVRRARMGAATHADELGVDPARIAVAGDSAGGNLAAVVAQLARDAGGPPVCFQLLDLPGDGPRVRQRRR